MDPQKQINELKREIDSLRNTIEHHKHDGVDGSSKLAYDIDLRAGQQFSVANAGAFSAAEDSTLQIASSMIVAGIDSNMANGDQNAQLTLQHQYGTNGVYADGALNQTFFFGFRSPLFGGIGSVTTGGTTMSQTTYQWDTNSLAGVHVSVNSGGTFNDFIIASNTSNQLTVSGGTWSFTNSAASYIIYVPVYLGAATYPWKRAYVTDTTAGGVRFGFGPTNGGLNGLLYSDSAGALWWRNYAGSATKLSI